jgi:hypothetical protein
MNEQPTRYDERPSDRLATLEASWSEVSELLREQVVRQPYSTLTGAMLLGFALGGGITPGLAAMLIGTAARTAMEGTVARFVSRGAMQRRTA